MVQVLECWLAIAAPALPSRFLCPTFPCPRNVYLGKRREAPEQSWIDLRFQRIPIEKIGLFTSALACAYALAVTDVVRYPDAMTRAVATLLGEFQRDQEELS